MCVLWLRLAIVCFSTPFHSTSIASPPLHSTPLLQGVDCVFEGNKLDACAFEAADTGAFYVCGQMGSAFINRNNSIRGNSFNNIRNTVGTGVQTASVQVQCRCRSSLLTSLYSLSCVTHPHFTHCLSQAIYLDDQMSGWSITNNTFDNCQIGRRC